MDEQKTWIKEAFNRSASTYGAFGCDFFEHFGRSVVTLADVRAGDMALDIATGTGAILFPLAEATGKAGHVTGIDISEGMLERARQQADAMGLTNVTLQLMDAEHLKFPDNTFDRVCCGFALFFMPSPERCLAEILRVLKPGGTFVTSIWDNSQKLPAWVAEEARKLGATKECTVSDIGTADQLQTLLQASGFNAIAMSQECRTFVWDSAEEWWAGLWTHSFRVIFEQLSEKDLADLKQRTLTKCAERPQIAEPLTAIFGCGVKGV